MCVGAAAVVPHTCIPQVHMHLCRCPYAWHTTRTTSQRQHRHRTHETCIMTPSQPKQQEHDQPTLMVHHSGMVMFPACSETSGVLRISPSKFLHSTTPAPHWRDTQPQQGHAQPCHRDGVTSVNAHADARDTSAKLETKQATIG